MHRILSAPSAFCSLVASVTLSAFGALTLPACAAAPPPPAAATVAKSAPAPATSTKITAFAVSNENLRVDKVGLRDGFMRPDGNRDLAFTATVDGEYETLFVVSTNAKGEPCYGLRADTLTGSEEVPSEFGGVVDTGRMTIGIGVVDGDTGKFINAESGSVHGGSGTHNLTFYISNTATLQPGSFVRLYVRAPGGSLVAGPVTPY